MTLAHKSIFQEDMMLFTGGIRLTEDPRFSLTGPTNSTLMVTKTFLRSNCQLQKV